MTAIGSSELRKALEDISSDDAKQAAKGIAIAAGIESESISFYAKQAEKFRGTDTEHFFRFLEGQEREHLAAIGLLQESLEKSGKWAVPKLPEKEKPKIFSRKDWDKEHGEGITAVLFALWKEKQAQEFYQGIAERVENQGTKHFFKALAEFEKGHADMLSEYVEDSYYSHELIMG